MMLLLVLKKPRQASTPTHPESPTLENQGSCGFKGRTRGNGEMGKMHFDKWNQTGSVIKSQKEGKKSPGRARITDDAISERTTSYLSALKRDYYRRTREVWKSLFQVLFTPQLKDNMLPEIKQAWVIVGIERTCWKWKASYGNGFLINEYQEFGLAAIP